MFKTNNYLTDPSVKTNPLKLPPQWLFPALVISAIVVGVFAAAAMVAVYVPTLGSLGGHFFSFLSALGPSGSITLVILSGVLFISGSLGLLLYRKKGKPSEEESSEEVKPDQPIQIVSSQPSNLSFGLSSSESEGEKPKTQVSKEVIKTEKPSLQNLSTLVEVTTINHENEETWQRTLDYRFEGHLWNLKAPTQAIAEDAFTYAGASQGYSLQLPALGVYSVQGYEFDDLILTMRLPPEKLTNFPPEVQEAISPPTLSNTKGEVELFFMVFATNSRTQESVNRNLSLHALAAPEYDWSDNKRYFPESAKREVEFEPTGKVRVRAQVGLFLPEGVIQAEKYSADSLKPGSVTSQRVTLHSTNQGEVCFSPANCAFTLDPEASISSFFITASFRGRAIAVAVLLVRDPSLTPNFAANTPREFLEKLSSNEKINNKQPLIKLFS